MQEALLEDYVQLMKQTYPVALYQRCKRIFRSIPEQLARENKKFMYKSVDSNARSREYAEAAQALCNLGIARKLPRLTSGNLPLEEHVDYKSFELFFIDHGLLRAAYGLPMNEEIDVNDILAEKCGAIAEQFIFQELSSKIPYLYYWVSGATARVPFVYEGEDAPVPVDIRFVRIQRHRILRHSEVKFKYKHCSESKLQSGVSRWRHLEYPSLRSVEHVSYCISIKRMKS